MPEKVLIANVRATTKDQPLMEIDFPALAKAMDEGWMVKQIESIPFTSQSNAGYTSIVFVLEKRQGGTVI